MLVGLINIILMFILVSVAGCLGYDVLGSSFLNKES